MVGETTNSTRPAVAEIATLISTQTALVTGIRAQLGLLGSLSDGLQFVPRAGTLRLNSEIWSWKRHGDGIMFEERSSHRRVDVHTRLDEPGVFDHWRLGTYFRSLGRVGAKILEKAIGRKGLAMDDAVARLLEQLLDAGVIEEVGNGFRLRENMIQERVR